MMQRCKSGHITERKKNYKSIWHEGQGKIKKIYYCFCGRRCYEFKEVLKIKENYEKSGFKTDVLEKLNRLEDYYLNKIDLISVELTELLRENNLTILKRKLVFLIEKMKGGLNKNGTNTTSFK